MNHKKSICQTCCPYKNMSHCRWHIRPTNPEVPTSLSCYTEGALWKLGTFLSKELSKYSQRWILAWALATMSSTCLKFMSPLLFQPCSWKLDWTSNAGNVEQLQCTWCKQRNEESQEANRLLKMCSDKSELGSYLL